MENDKEKIKAEKAESEFKNQINNYASLGITKSSRGQVVLFFGVMFLITIVLTFINVFDSFLNIADVLLGLVVYIPVLFFVYKGHRWAMIVLMILWTFDKVYTAIISVENGNSIIGSIIFLIIGLSIIYKALKVENEKRKILKSESFIKKGSFCPNCGAKQESDANFCLNCGTKII